MVMLAAVMMFNIFYIFYTRAEQRRGMERSLFAAFLRRQVSATAGGGALSGRGLFFLRKGLHRTRHLLSFEDVMDQAGTEERTSFLRAATPAFILEMGYFQSAASMKKALFAHLIARFHIARDNLPEEYYAALLKFLDDPSLYCRDAAFKALLTIGSDEDILLVFEKLRNRRRYFFAKELLEAFNCVDRARQERYLELLMPFLPSYDAELQTAILKILRKLAEHRAASASSGSAEDAGTSQHAHDAELRQMLHDEGIEQSVKVEILRYFRHSIYPPVAEDLIAILSYRRTAYRDMIIAAIRTLDLYYDDVAEQALKGLLKARDYEIRELAVRVMTKHGVAYYELIELYDGDDAQVRRLLKYMDESSEREAHEEQG